MDTDIRSIENFVAFDLRPMNYKVSKKQIIEKHKLSFAIGGLSFYAAAATLAIESFEKSDYTFFVYSLLVIGLMSLSYFIITEWSGYSHSKYFFNMSAIVQLILVWMLLFLFSIWIILYSQASIVIFGVLSAVSFFVAFLISIRLISSRIKMGYYSHNMVRSKCNRYLAIAIAISLIIIGRIVASFSISIIGYALIVFITLLFTNSILFYGLQIYYAKKYSLECLLPQVRYVKCNNENEPCKSFRTQVDEKETDQNTQNTEFPSQELGSMGNKYNFGKKWGK